MHVAYVTAELPYGVNEPFIIPEITELERQGCRVTIVPVRPSGGIVHGDARKLLPQTVRLPLVSLRTLLAVLREALRSPLAVGRALSLLRHSRSIGVLLKNLVVFPKGIWLGRYAREAGVQHLHAHWGGTTATLAMVSSEASGIPWSMTAHRWDIREDNLLGIKVRRASFVRVINELGAESLREVVKAPLWRPWVLHMGVRLPRRGQAEGSPDAPFRALTAANFLEVKGHVYLVDALRELKARRVPVRVEFAGDGPLEGDIERRVREHGLQDHVKFLGRVPHEELLRDMASGTWHAAVLPSVTTPSGENEGIPVFLMEAMACEMAVIATRTGGIPELLGDGAGLLVPDKAPEALAAALESLAQQPELRREVGRRGRMRVEEAFAVEPIVASLRARFASCVAGSESSLMGGA
jgi:glycosyltransferase involved in cell wall biosynthesis